MFQKSVFTRAHLSRAYKNTKHRQHTLLEKHASAKLRWYNTYTSIAYVVFIASHSKLLFKRIVHSHRSATAVGISVRVTNSARAKREASV